MSGESRASHGWKLMESRGVASGQMTCYFQVTTVEVRGNGCMIIYHSFITVQVTKSHQSESSMEIYTPL